MSSRSVVAGIALAIVSVAPLAGVAHAQDLDCADFRYQEDAQDEFNRNTTDPNRLDEDQGPDDEIACERLPRRGDTDTVPVNPIPPADPTPAPIAPSALPVVPAPVVPTPVTPAPVTPAPVTPAPVTPAPVTPAPVTPAPVVPSLGTRAGIGGASGPSGLSMALGLALAIGATAAGGYLTARRLGRGPKRS
ncbi:excalibur calcium-binding protein [Streptomyces venezuelae]|uniref:excalibur calcium-binding protein n=1 Tax=Streptomyces venezuelae TaxID=54571 RepID=UPI0037D24654